MSLEMHQNHPGMDVEAPTFHCSSCDQDILSTNQLTHEVVCARLQRENQRNQGAQRIVRQSSSSAIPDSLESAPQRLPIARREERRIAENKYMTCPNCEERMREQDFSAHNDQCLKKDLIPCEFCDQSIPMSSYNDHINSCPRRSQNAQEDRIPEQEPVEQIPLEEEPIQEEQSESSPNERERPQEQGSSQGGIRGFFSNLASTAANHLRQLANPPPSNNNEESSLLSQLLGLQERRSEPWPQLRQEPRAESRPEPRQAPRQVNRQEEIERDSFASLFQPNHQMGNPFMQSQNQNALIPYQRPRSRVVQTIELGPNGELVLRRRVVPQNPQMQFFQQPSNNPRGLEDMGGLGMLLNMMNGGFPGGMQAIDFGGNEAQAPEPEGLNKETIDSLAVVKYNKEANKNVDSESKKCPICLDEFEEGQNLRFLWCMHRFHQNCVDTWLEKHTNCPICKKDFAESQQEFA